MVGLGTAVAVVLLFVACGPGPRIPRLEDLPPQTSDESVVGGSTSVVGTVVSQEVEYGEPEPDLTGGDGLVALEVVVITIARQDGLGPVEMIIPQGYVPYPPPDVPATALEVPEGQYSFYVRLREDGRYECASPVCVREVP